MEGVVTLIMLPIHDPLNARLYVLFILVSLLRHVLAFIYGCYFSFPTFIVRRFLFAFGPSPEVSDDLIP